MIESEEQLRQLVDQAEAREHKSRRNALLYTLIPILVAVVLLTVTGWQVQKASQNLADTQAKLDKTSRDLTVAESTLDTTQKTLGVAEGDLSDANRENAQVKQKLVENSRVLTDTLNMLTEVTTKLASVSQELADNQKELEAKQAEIDSLQKQIDELSDQLTLLKRFEKYTMDDEVLLYVEKHTWNLYYENRLRQGVFELWEKIMANQRVSWKLYGTSLKDGVNSPTYVALLLGLLPDPASYSIDQNTLIELLPMQQKQPQIGDVVYYKEGLTFFYFEDEEGKGWVIGMSPFGVIATNFEFDEPLGIGIPFR